MSEHTTEEQARAVEALKASEQRLNAYIDNSPMATIEWDENFTVIRWAGEAETIFGWKAEEMLGKHIMDLHMIYDEDVFLVESTMMQLSDPTAKHVYNTNRNYTKDGRVISCEWYNSILRDDQGRMTSILSLVLDVTGRILAEEALAVKQQQLEELNRSLEERIDTAVSQLRQRDHLLASQNRLAALGEMISTIAHQWRQPLNNIGLLLQNTVLAYRKNSLNAEQFGEQVAQCMTIIRDMSQTIDEFSRFFRPDTEKQPFSVAEAVQRAVSIIRASLQKRCIALEVIDEEPGSITGYPNEYAQVILNLLKNAQDILVERMGDEGKIKVRCGRQGGRAVVTVQDNGGGIDPADLPRIFDPYFTTRGVSQGGGLGLYLSKMIIEESMGGRITVNAGDGGTVFALEV